MLDYKLNDAEQETVINKGSETTIRYDKVEPVAEIYTASRREMNRLDKLCKQYPDIYKCIWIDTQIMGDGRPMGKRYTMPIKILRYGKPASEAKKAAARENASKINSKL